VSWLWLIGTTWVRLTKPISVARFVQEVDSLLARKEPVTADA
jgi:hypothetical protein